MHAVQQNSVHMIPARRVAGAAAEYGAVTAPLSQLLSGFITTMGTTLRTALYEPHMWVLVPPLVGFMSPL